MYMELVELYHLVIQDPEINVVHPVLEAILMDCCESVICCCKHSDEQINMAGIVKAAYLLAIMDLDSEVTSALNEVNSIALMATEEEIQLPKTLVNLQDLTFFE